jgi:hypothetical protein
MPIAADNHSIIEIGDSQVSTQSEDYESRRREIPETQSQGMKAEEDDVVICPAGKLWETGRAIRVIVRAGHRTVHTSRSDTPTQIP